jgi:mediator of RNA polymerase II transcription subunit 18
MSSHLYEVALSGGFWPPDLGAVLHRAALHAEACAPFRARELVFEPLDAAAQRATGTEPELLRARREVLEPGADWCAPFRRILLCNVYAEPAPGCSTRSSSLSPSACTRRRPCGRGRPSAPPATRSRSHPRLDMCAFIALRPHPCPCADGPCPAEARRRAHASQIYKAGYAFRRGPLVILVSQQEQVRAGRSHSSRSLLTRCSASQVDPRTEAPVPASASAPWEVEVKTAQPVRNTQETPLPVAIAAVLEVQRLLRGLLDLRRLDV